MKLLSYSLLALLLAVLIGSYAGSDPGLFYLSLSEWTIQTSATVFIIILIIGFLFSYFAIRAIARLINMPGDIQAWRTQRHQRCAEKYLTDGLIHMTEGRYRRAERDFCKAARHSNTPYIHYLCAARAAQESGAVDRRDNFLRLAYQNSPDADLAVGITQAELQLSQKQTEQALATLTGLQNKQPDQSQVKQLLLHTYTDLHDWYAVLEMLPAVEKTGLYSREQIQARQLEAYSGLLRQAGHSGDRQQLDKFWANIPRKLKQHFYLIEVYVNERLMFEDTRDCEVLLRNAIKQHWDASLVRLYGLIKGSDPDRQLSIAEAFLQTHARDAVLLLTLGRICKRKQLWGKANRYLQESIDVQANPEAYYELARLHEHEGRSEQAAVCYEKGLALVTQLKQQPVRVQTQARLL